MVNRTPLKSLLYSSCLLFFRHISQKYSAIYKAVTAFFVLSDENISEQSEYSGFSEGYNSIYINSILQLFMPVLL